MWDLEIQRSIINARQAERKARAEREPRAFNEYHAEQAAKPKPQQKERFVSLEEMDFDRKMAYAAKAVQESEAKKEAERLASEKAREDWLRMQREQDAQRDAEIEKVFIEEFTKAGE